jgi:hypothetical protein
LQLGCAGDVDSGIEGDGDIDGRTYTVAAVSSGSGDSSDFGGSVEQDGNGVLILFAVAKSGLPSPLKSPMLTERGSLPVGKVTWVAKVGVAAPVGVVLSRMEPFC